MALSDISLKTARSDLRSRLGKLTTEEFSDVELRQWLNYGQFDVFLRLSSISDIWYGTTQTIILGTALAGQISAHSLSGNYAPTKIAKIIKLVTSTDVLIPFKSDSEIHALLLNTNYESDYAANWFGEKLYIFVGANATALTNDAATLYFIRKPDEMVSDTSVWTTVLASVVAGNTFNVQYGGATITFTCVANQTALDTGVSTDQGAFFVVGATDTDTAANLVNAINNVFGSEISASSNNATLTVNGAAKISGSTTFTNITEAMPAYVDVPSEFVDLVVMSAISKALFKLNMMGEKQQVEQDIVARFNDIRSLYQNEMQYMQLEKQPGIQTGRNR